MSRTTLGLFGSRRQAAPAASAALADCRSGLTPIERSAIEAMGRKRAESRRG